jgi:hypothetical protein
LQALHYLSRLANAPFKNIFGYQKGPEFITTIGQSNMTVTGSGFWGHHSNRKNWQASYNFLQQGSNSWSPSTSWKVDQQDEENAGECQALIHGKSPIE